MIAAVATMASLTWMRLWRGRTIWLSALLCLLPPVMAGLAAWRLDEDAASRWYHVAVVALRSTVLMVPVIHLAPVLGEEIDAKTYTYLWSRPIPRGAIVLGKLLALVPAVLVATMVSISATFLLCSLGSGDTQLAWLWPTLAAAAAGVVSASTFAVGLGAAFPRHPMVVAFAWVMIGEQLLPGVPSIQNISTLFHTAILAQLPGDDLASTSGVSPVRAAITLAILSTIWLALALWRARKLEP